MAKKKARKPRRPHTKFVAATVEHKKTMDRMLDRKLQVEARKIFEAEAKVLRKALNAQLRGRHRAVATLGDAKKAEAVVRAQMLRMGKALKANLVATTKETQVESVRSLAAFLGRIKPTGTSLDTDLTRETLIRGRRKALEAARRTASAAMITNMHHAVRQSIKGTKLGEMKVGDLIQHVEKAVHGQWWQVDRTLRTENSRAFNVMQADAFKILRHEFPGIRQRWTEMVNDLTGAPLDNRVANDSLVLHGQVASPGGIFTMPPHPLAPSVMVGKVWTSPPNRPNDRAVLTPWFSGMGIPSWEYHGGIRINLK